jgi:hypothetical protein
MVVISSSPRELSLRNGLKLHRPRFLHPTNLGAPPNQPNFLEENFFLWSSLFFLRCFLPGRSTSIGDIVVWLRKARLWNQLFLPCAEAAICQMIILSC